jgi:hypothetical protein
VHVQDAVVQRKELTALTATIYMYMYIHNTTNMIVTTRSGSGGTHHLARTS